jgi:hypothetical protein
MAAELPSGRGELAKFPGKLEKKERVARTFWAFKGYARRIPTKH